MVTSFDVTRRALSFGAQDTTTGWYEKVRTDITIKGSVQPKGSSAFGVYNNKYTNAFITEYPVNEGDQIVDADLYVYELATVEKWSIGNVFSHYMCEAVLQEEANPDASSGTWHLDGDSLTTDPRSRTKTYLETYPLTGNYELQFDGQPYLMKYLFNNKLGVDADFVVSVGLAPANALYTDKGYPYGFVEHPTISLWAVNKSGHTAPNVIEKAEQEIRHILTDHPFVAGRSKRVIEGIKYNHQAISNGNYLWSTEITLRYKRANDDYTPTLPTITWGASAGTFTFPNVINKVERYVNNDVYMDVPGRLGSYPQALGSKSLEVELTCDLDVNPDNLTWQRAQAGAKTDVCSYQVFQDIIHEGADSEAYQTLTLDWGSFKVRLTDMQLGQDEDKTHLTLTFTEYNDVAGNTDYRHRWGISH